MFTGIIETLAKVQNIKKEGTNYHLSFQSSISNQLKIDQSLAHNGVCLTVVALEDDVHTVTAIEETMLRSNFSDLKIGDLVNLERAMVANARLDGHIVQGHVDTTGVCKTVKELEGSWYYSFKYKANPNHILVDKGSVCINGVSLTVVNPTETEFSVAIIPYTHEHTSFKNIVIGSRINLEFDIIGKYIAKYAKLYLPK